VPEQTPPSPPAGHSWTTIGLGATYLTIGDLTEPAPGLERVVLSLAAIPIERTLDWVARMLAPSGLASEWVAHQQQLAGVWFDRNGRPGARALQLVSSGERVLLAPQVLLVLARLALIHGGRRPAGDHEDDATVERSLVIAMLILGHHMGSRRRQNDEQFRGPDGTLVLNGPEITDLEVSIAANMLINRHPYVASVFDRFARRWLEIPTEQADQPGAVDLAAEFQAATGVSMNDMSIVATALWARAIGPSGPLVGPDDLTTLGLGIDRTERVLSLLSGSVDELRQETESSDQTLDPEFDLSLFNRRPVVRLSNGGLLILSPPLLLERAFGWLPRWDMTNGLEEQGKAGRARADRALRFLRETTEIHALEALERVAVAGAADGSYRPEAVQAAFGTSRPNADCVLAWPSNWVIAEISSRPVARQAAGAASAAALLEEMRMGIVSKARQIAGTIDALRTNETALTGRAAPTPDAQKRFWPVLVTTEGFPVHTLMNQRIKSMLDEAGYLTAADTGDLVIVDTEALEAVEAVSENGGPNFPELLAEHAQSELHAHAFKEWLLVTKSNRPPSRLMDRWARVVESVLRAMQENADGQT
jgi:hypothetical protein